MPKDRGRCCPFSDPIYNEHRWTGVIYLVGYSYVSCYRRPLLEEREYHNDCGGVCVHRECVCYALGKFSNVFGVKISLC